MNNYVCYFADVPIAVNSSWIYRYPEFCFLNQNFFSLLLTRFPGCFKAQSIVYGLIGIIRKSSRSLYVTLQPVHFIAKLNIGVGR